VNFAVRLLICSLTAVLGLTGSALAAANVEPGAYVALGDSYTAAPLVLPTQPGSPGGCARSQKNYPSVVRAALGSRVFRDVSCSAATSEDMRRAQRIPGGANVPQFSALSADTTLVTIGIGGNDVGLVGAAAKCIGLGLLAPTGTACRSSFAQPGGGDALTDQIAAAAAKIAATLDAIHQRAPQARVLIVGYPAVAPGNGKGCYPLVPLSDDDIAYLDAQLRATNAMIADQAAAHDAEYVDTYDESAGHDACTLPPTRWFEGLIPTMPAFPVHPNVLGEASMARSVLRVLGTPRPGPVISRLIRAARTVTAGRAARLTFTLNRAAPVAFALQRSRGKGRYTKPRTVATVDGRIGDNALKLTAGKLGRRAGLYRLTATPAGGEARRVQLRIRRAR
jgi:lysophospholipase L1-like esterase